MFNNNKTTEIIFPTQSEERGRSRRVTFALLAALALPACAADQPGDGATGSNRSALDGQNALGGTANAGRSFAKYIAFGDSFSSGFGDDPDRSLAQYPVIPCTGVSAHPWPKMLWEQTLKPANPQVKYEEQFCSGHVIADMSKAIAKMSQAPANSLITFTIGGNDTGVSSELKNCLDTDCKDVRARVLNKLQSKELRDGLGGLVDALRAKAPSSTIVMVGYPHLIAENAGAACAPGLTADKARIVNELIDKMNTLISDVATQKSKVASNKKITIKAVTSALVTKFKGHEACSPQEWIGISTLMHPGADGHLAYAQVVAAALGGSVPTRIATVAPDMAGGDGTSSPDSTASNNTGDETGDLSSGGTTANPSDTQTNDSNDVTSDDSVDGSDEDGDEDDGDEDGDEDGDDGDEGGDDGDEDGDDGDEDGDDGDEDDGDEDSDDGDDDGDGDGDGDGDDGDEDEDGDEDSDDGDDVYA